MIRYLRQNNFRIVTMSFIILITIWGMHLRYQRRICPLWQDEMAQVHSMKGSFSAAIASSVGIMQGLGDYLLIYPFYQWFGENIWGLAIPHIIITLLGFYLLYMLCRKYFKTPWAYLITFSVFASNYTLIRHAFEIRPYSVLATLSIAIFLVMQYIFECVKPPPIKRILISVFIFVAILFHPFSVFMLFFSYIFHLLLSRKDKTVGVMFLKHLKHYGMAILFALPLLLWSLSNHKHLHMGHNTFEYIHKGVISVLKGIFGNLTGRRIFYLLLPGIVINLFIPHSQRLKQAMFFTILIVIPIGLLFLACIYFQYWFIQRLFIWAIPLFIFFLGWSWDSIFVYFGKKVSRN